MITASEIRENALVTFVRENARGVKRVKTGRVDPRYLPDERGEMMVRIGGKLYVCNVSEVISTHG